MYRRAGGAGVREATRLLATEAASDPATKSRPSFVRRCDGHLLEYLTMLDDEPKPDLGILPWSEWLAQSKQ